MKKSFLSDSFMGLVFVAAVLLLATKVTAQTMRVLCSFAQPSTNGESPRAGVILCGGVLFGTTVSGGAFGGGVVFALNTDGSNFTNLYSLDGSGSGVGSLAGLVVCSNTLSGTTYYAGAASNGAVFALEVDGTGFRTLHDFSTYSGPFHFNRTNSDGAAPNGTLARSGDTVFGVAQQGGFFSHGTIFRINTDGSGFTNLHSFSAYQSVPWTMYYNLDGGSPRGGLIISGDTLYGTTSMGGGFGLGTVFKMNVDGSGFTTLHSFNGNGATPEARLTLCGDTLYGTTWEGGLGGSNFGIVFAINTNGTAFTNIHAFSMIPGWPPYTNSDGGNPSGGLLVSGKTLYGLARTGGTGGSGTLFKLNLDGTGFATLHSFGAAEGEGSSPEGDLIQSGNTLYGTTQYGGQSNAGTVFSLLVLPQLSIVSSPENVVLSWPTNAMGFTLESTTSLLPPAEWTNESASPTLVDGYNVVTNSVSGPQKFYRLRL